MNTYPLPPNKKTTTKVRSPLVCFLAAVGWFLVASQCFHLNRYGSDWAGAGGILCCGFGFRSFFQALYFQHQLLRVGRQEKRYKEAAKRFAAARYAEVRDCKETGILGNRGVVLGYMIDKAGRKRVIRDNTEKLIILLGQPGSNKTTSVFISSLLPEGKMGGIGHSAILNDPAGEGYAVCKAALEAAGYRVVAICPWAEEMSKRLGIPIEDVGFHVWSDFTDATDPSKWETMVLAKSGLFIPDRPKDDGKTEFFLDAGRMIFQFIALYILAAGRIPTPAMMRQMALEGEELLAERCNEVIESDTNVAALKARALSLLGTLTRAPEEFSGGLSECKRSLLPFFSDGPMGSHFTTNGFDPRCLKDDKPTVAFVIYPTDKIRSHRRAVNITFSHLIEQLGADPRVNKRVTFLIDECASIGFLPNLINGIAENRKMSLRFVLAFQQFSGQVEETFSKAILKLLRGSAAVLWGANIRDPDDLAMFSKFSGTTTVDVVSKHDPNSQQTSNSTEQSVTNSFRERPLMRDEDVRGLSDDEVLIVHSNMPIIRAFKTCYWKFPRWNSIAKPNPYNKS